MALPTGCAFHPRCEYSLGEDSVCSSEIPELRSVAGSESRSACHLSDEQIVQIGKTKVLS